MSRECAPHCSYETQSTHNLLPYMDNGKSEKDENRWTFEVAWEVANKVGDIYTVIKSKAHVSTQEMGDNYCLLGPYIENSSRNELEETEFAANSPLTAAVHIMRSQGYQLYTGTWLADGSPQVILFQTESAFHQLDLFKEELRESCKVMVHFLDFEVDDAVILGFMVSRFIAEFRKVLETYSSAPPRVVGHFHGWEAGVGLIVLCARKVDVATVFTAHGTLLGRRLCASNTDFYNNLHMVPIFDEAKERGIRLEFNLEVRAIHTAHVFTTVSDITGFEADRLLRRTPDVITPNGLNMKNLSFQNLHSTAKEKIHEFVRAHFYGHLNFNLEKTLYFFIAGRYEYTNKGVDIFMESLARLNYYLQSSGSDITVIAFLIFPAKTNGLNEETLRRQAIAKSLRDTIRETQQKIEKRMYEACSSGNVPEASDLLHNEDIVRLKSCVYSLQRDGLPPVTTHNVVDTLKDPILYALRCCQLKNANQDRVKVIFHPEYLTPTNPLFGMDIKEFMCGCHLGVFPSYYEPWGYTPAECTAMGVPVITTNLSGFGCFMQKHVADPTSHGVYVLDRRHVYPIDYILQLAQFMLDFTKLSRDERVIQRSRAVNLSDLLDWKNLSIYYRQARAMALESVYKTNVDHVEPTLASASLNPISVCALHNPIGLATTTPRPPSPSPTHWRPVTPATSPHEPDNVESDEEMDFVNLWFRNKK